MASLTTTAVDVQKRLRRLIGDAPAWFTTSFVLRLHPGLAPDGVVAGTAAGDQAAKDWIMNWYIDTDRSRADADREQFFTNFKRKLVVSRVAQFRFKQRYPRATQAASERMMEVETDLHYLSTLYDLDIAPHWWIEGNGAEFVMGQVWLKSDEDPLPIFTVKVDVATGIPEIMVNIHLMEAGMAVSNDSMKDGYIMVKQAETVVVDFRIDYHDYIASRMGHPLVLPQPDGADADFAPGYGSAA